MKANRKLPLQIGISVLRNIKSQRAKLSGVLRYASTKPDWRVVILEGLANPDVQLDAMVILIRGAIQLLKTGMPAVTVDQDADDTRLPHVFIDDSAIGKAAAKFFLQRGFANLATVRTLDEADDVHSKQRTDAFVAAAAKAKTPVSIYTPSSARESTFLCGNKSFLKWLASLPKPCGLLCFNDRQARDILDCCRMIQLSIPNQVAILGIDNETEICELTRPTLSSIQPDFEMAGYLAAKVLDDLIKGRKNRIDNSSYGVFRLVDRESTNPTNAGGLVVSKALRLMQADDPILTVAGLARKLHVSTTLLNNRFNEILGHGPKEEIDRRRLEKIKELLRDPILSVAQIGNLCHFAYAGELHRFFRRYTGMTPTQWRQRDA